MKKYVIGLIISGLVIFSGIGIAMAGENCPSCGGSMYFTGETKTDWGKLFYLYKCPSGHAWWIKAPSYTPPSSGNDFSFGPKCPTCGASVYFTGETYIEWGKLFKVYRCPSGHRSVGR